MVDNRGAESLRAALKKRAEDGRRVWTQASLAAAIGVKQQHVSKWQRGERKPNTQHRVRMSDLLEIEILDWDEPVSHEVAA